MVGRKCTVCESPKRLAVEAAVDAGGALRSVARAHGLKYDSLRRHMANHAHQAPAGVVAGTPSNGIEALVQRLENEARGQTGRAFLDTARELRLALGELAKAGGGAREVDIRDVAGWAELRALLLDALRPFPEARQAVAEAIRSRGAAARNPAPRVAPRRVEEAS